LKGEPSTSLLRGKRSRRDEKAVPLPSEEDEKRHGGNEGGEKKGESTLSEKSKHSRPSRRIFQMERRGDHVFIKGWKRGGTYE